MRGEALKKARQGIFQRIISGGGRARRERGRAAVLRQKRRGFFPLHVERDAFAGVRMIAHADSDAVFRHTGHQRRNDTFFAFELNVCADADFFWLFELCFGNRHDQLGILFAECIGGPW